MDCAATVFPKTAPNFRQTYLHGVRTKSASARSDANLLPKRSYCFVPKFSARAMLVQSLQHPFDLPLGESQRKICGLLLLQKIFFGKILQYPLVFLCAGSIRNDFFSTKVLSFDENVYLSTKDTLLLLSNFIIGQGAVHRWDGVRHLQHQTTLSMATTVD